MGLQAPEYYLETGRVSMNNFSFISPFGYKISVGSCYQYSKYYKSVHHLIQLRHRVYVQKHKGIELKSVHIHSWCVESLEHDFIQFFSIRPGVGRSVSHQYCMIFRRYTQFAVSMTPNLKYRRQMLPLVSKIKHRIPLPCHPSL